MSPKCESAVSMKPGRQHTKEKPESPSQGIQKTRKTSTPRRSTRLRAKRYSNTPTAYASPPEPLQESDPAHDPPDTRKRKRSCGSENGPPENERKGKRPRTDLQSVFGVRKPLSEYNLQTHNKLLMDPEVDSSGGVKRTKRPASRTRTESGYSTPTTTQETSSIRSQKSSSTSAHYRWSVLEKARVYVRPQPPLEEIQTQIDAVIQRNISLERREELSRIAQELCDGFVKVLDRASGEDDGLLLLDNALSSMNYNESLTFARKADWRLNLKPCIQRTFWSLGSADEPQHEAEDSTIRPSKRQQADTSYLSPDTSASATTGDMNPKKKALKSEPMPPPPKPDTSPVKTPRPDITIGLSNAVIVKALQSQGLNDTEADDFLKELEEMKTRNGSEPVLCSEPTQRALRFRFPFLVIEGKAYATGRPVFDAQNQAAVSGACALKILHDLADLADRANLADRVSPEDHSKEINPLVFTICTEGPYHELWAHYTTTKNGVRMFNMVIVQICHGLFRDQVLQFFMAVENVMSWGTGDVLKDIVERLGRVAEVAKRTERAGPGA